MELNGDFAVVWQSDETGSKRDLDAALSGERHRDRRRRPGVGHVDGNDDTDPSIAMDDDGDFVVAWQSEDQDGDNWGIFARRYDSAGVALGTAAVPRERDDHRASSRRPDVAMDADGDFVVVVGRQRREPTTTGASTASAINAAGTRRRAASSGSTPSIANEQDHGLGFDGRRRPVRRHLGEQQPGRQRRRASIARSTSPRARSTAASFLVNTTTNGDQKISAVAMDDSGGYVVAWSGDGRRRDSDGVCGAALRRRRGRDDHRDGLPRRRRRRGPRRRDDVRRRDGPPVS